MTETRFKVGDRVRSLKDPHFVGTVEVAEPGDEHYPAGYRVTWDHVWEVPDAYPNRAVFFDRDLVLLHPLIQLGEQAS